MLIFDTIFVSVNQIKGNAMKTYLVPVHSSHLRMIGVIAYSKNSAYELVKAKHKDARKTGITISSCHLDFISDKLN